MSRAASETRNRWLAIVGIAGVVVVLLVADSRRSVSPEPSPKSLLLHLAVTQDLAVVANSDFGEPPQIAVWLEPLPGGRPRTLFVTRRAGTGDWLGKSECPDALPRWFAVYRAEYGDEIPYPNLQHPLPDAIARATPLCSDFTIEAQLSPGSRWRLWLEVNLSADYNETFPAVDENGRDDLHANGQPSLLYIAEFAAESISRLPLRLAGRSVPNSLDGELTADLGGIDSARKILSKLVLRLDFPPANLNP